MQEIETKTTNCQVRELHRKLRIIKHIAEKEAFIRQMAAALCQGGWYANGPY